MKCLLPLRLRSICAFFAALSAATACVAEPPAEARPNFVIVYTDDHQFRALGVNDNDVLITPALDAMAAKGMNFTQARIVLPLCSPSRAALLTGRYNSKNGVWRLDRGLNAGEITFSKMLQDAGYRTAAIGKWHLGRRPTDENNRPTAVGFDVARYCWSNGPYYNRVVFDTEGNRLRTGEQHIDEYASDHSIAFLREAAASGEPFFLFHCTQTPHLDGSLVWDAKEQTKAKYDVDDIVLPENWQDDLDGKPEYMKTVRGRTKAQNDYGYHDEAKLRAHTRDYYAVITELDDALGRLFAELEALGVMDNTYIIFMGDNGWFMGDHGMTSKVFPHDASSRVPMFIVGPGIEAGSSSDAAVLNIDVMPTVLSLAGLDTPAKVHGEDLTPVLTGKADKVRDIAVLEILGGFGGNKPMLAAFDGRYQLVWTFEDREDKDPSFVELYDLENDPWEFSNVAETNAVRAVRARLGAALRRHQQTVLQE